MIEVKDLLQSADWKKEKHVPVIEVPDKVGKGKSFNVKVGVGKEISHPNTTEHHIRFISVYFLADGEKFPHQIAKIDFTCHGESTEGPNTSTIYTDHEAIVSFKTDKRGTIITSSFCNIHGLWWNSKDILVE